MLKLYEIPLYFPKGYRVHAAMGSIFHGALLERLEPALANALHQQTMRPYRQTVFWDKKRKQSFWQLGIFNDEAEQGIISALRQSPRLYLKQQGYEVQLGSFSCQADTVEHIFQQCSSVAGAEITFCSTTGFKRNGAYVLFPESALLYHSVILRWPLLASKVLEPSLEEMLDYYTIIQRYDLHTTLFSVDGRSIPGFAGTIGLRFCGTKEINQIAAALLCCAVYTGIGLKTALGMGAVRVRIKE